MNKLVFERTAESSEEAGYIMDADSDATRHRGHDETEQDWQFGEMLAAAPNMLALLKKIVQEWENGPDALFEASEIGAAKKLIAELDA